MSGQGGGRWYKRKVKFWNATKCNIKTQTLTILVNVKSDRCLQLMDHQGSPFSKSQSCDDWKGFAHPLYSYRSIVDPERQNLLHIA